MDYVNERPRPEQRGAADPPDRRLCLQVWLTVGVLCIIQAILNVSLRLTVSSSEVSNQSGCNTSRSGDQNQMVVEPKCEEGGPTHCNTLQENFNALTAEKNMLLNQNNELTNRLKELSRQCPANWRKISSRCYYLSNRQNTWGDSRAFCKREDADLVVINSEQELRALNRLDDVADLPFWIGLTRFADTFIWVDGSALTQPFWSIGQPNDGGPVIREDCVEINHRSAPLLNWNDAPCRSMRHWMCEKSPQSSLG